MKQKIKIVFLHWCLVCGGAESALLDLVNLLDKDIFDITVFAMYGGGEWTDRFIDAGVTVIDSYSCIKSSKTPWGKIHNLIKTTKITNILSKDACTDLLRYCTPNDYDIVISYHIDSAHMAAGFSKTAKTIRYIHGDATTNPALQKQLQSLCETSFAYDKIICVSECAKRGLLRYCNSPVNIAVCHNPINSEKILAMSQAPMDIDMHTEYICAVGRLVEAKGFARLIRMFAAIEAELPDMKLLIIGEGPERAHIQDTIHALHLDGKVILAGYLANPYPYLAHARFSVCSSYTEGLHIASMESILLGTPVLSIYPTISEIMGNEKCGAVVDSEEAFVQYMREMCTDQNLYSQMKQAAARRSSAFTGKALAEAVTKEYLDVLEN